MNDTAGARSTSAPDHLRTALNLALADQARSWQQGAPTSVEHYLEREPALRSDPEAVLDLIYKEVLLRTERGEKPQLGEYARRFPELAGALGPIFEVHAALESGADLDATCSLTESPDCPTSGGPTTGGPSAPPPALPGYELLQRLGHGGMGVVYKARQKNLDRIVALKMILAGAHASTEELARFRHEAEAVARLKHPSIVQIHEVGAHEGQPFLCLEFVEEGGLDKKLGRKPQPPKEAAALVEQLARVVHYAHSQGVVHRDLKPANILLTAGGTPKITDFGLARLGAGSGQTQSGEVLGTPSYMAPEQAAGRVSAIGPLTDVYALGAILYELLTGRPPFLADNPIATVRQVLEEEPVPPTRLQSSVPRDLETVCLKCLQKSPNKRYASAEAVADDLHRFLNGFPIMARPTPAWERTLKWARRRPALALLVGVSIAAVVAVVVYNVRLQAALREANEQRLITQAINDFLLFDLLRQADARAQADRNFAPNPNLHVRDLLDRAAATIEIRLRDRPLVESGVRLSIGDAYRSIGEIAKALEQIERAVALYREHRGPEHPDTLVATNNLATTYAAAGKHEQALRLQLENVEKLKRTLGLDDSRTLIGMANLASTYAGAGRRDRAVPLLEETLKIRQTKFGSDHPDTLTSMNNLALAYAESGEVKRAVELFEATVEKRKAKLGAGHPDTLTSMHNLAFAYSNVDRRDKAIPIYKEILEKRKTALGPEHPDTLGTMNNLATTYQNAQQLDEALPLFEETLRKLQARFGADHPRVLISAANLASAYHEAGRSDRAALERAIELYEQTLEKQRKIGGARPDAITTMNNLASAYRDAGKLDRAIPLLQEAWEKFKVQSGPNHPDTIKCLNNLALVTLRGGKIEQAILLMREAMDKIETRLGPDHADTRTVKYNLAQAYFQVRRPADAEPLLADHVQRSRPKLPPDSFTLAFPLNLLGDCRVQLRQHAEALDPLREALSLYEKHAPQDVLRYDTQSLLGAALAGQKNFAAAEPHLLESYHALAGLDPELRASRRALVTAALERIVHFYEASGQQDKAGPWRKKLIERRQQPKSAP